MSTPKKKKKKPSQEMFQTDFIYNLYNAAKTVKRERFISLNYYIRKETSKRVSQSETIKDHNPT